MSKITKMVLLGLGVLLVVGLAIAAFSDQPTEDTPQATSTPEDVVNDEGVPSSWEETETSGLGFRHPPAAQVSTEAGMTKIQLLGEGNETGTEVTDGLTGYIYTEPRAEDGLEATAEQIFNQEQEGSEAVVDSLSEADFADRSGYTFQLRNQLGSITTYYILPGEDDAVLVTSFVASGPDASMYEQTFEDIIATVETAEVQEDASAPDSEVGGDESTADGQRPSYATMCESANGNRLSEHNECEGVSQDWCSQYGGSYESCASACRHDPDADVCTEQCVQVCSF